MTSSALGLDPWTDIIKCHFPPSDVTKLDFVNNRYRVKNKEQHVEDVINHPEYRGLEGLDLRDFTVYDTVMSETPFVASLKNKTSEPSKANPGALNEFLFLNYTMVFEFDWYDVLSMQQTLNPTLTHVDAIYEFIRYRDLPGQKFWYVTNAEERTVTAGTPAHDVTQNFPFYPVYGPMYDTGFSNPADAGDAFFHFNDPDGPAGTIGDWYYADDGQVVTHQENFDNINYPLGAGPYYLWRTGFADDPPGTQAIVSMTQPPPYVASYHVDELFGEDYFNVVPYAASYEQTFASSDIDGRILGAIPDPYFASASPIKDPAPATDSPSTPLGIPYGRNRIAITATKKKLTWSVNGSNPFEDAAPESFFTPTPTGGTGTPKFFEITLDEFGRPNLQFSFQFPGCMRCLWLFRKPKAKAALKKMSVVQPLPFKSSPKWLKPPGSDQ